MMKMFLYVLGGLILLGAVFVYSQRCIRAAVIYPAENLQVASPAFPKDGPIPKKHTGRGENVSPELVLKEVAKEAQSIAVIMDDMDHPIGAFNHWVIFNIPASFSMIPEHVEQGESVTSLGGAVQGRSEYGGKHYYRGPKPPFGTHQYIFRVYVLDAMLDLSANTNKNALLKAMEGHILQYGTLTGSFGN